MRELCPPTDLVGSKPFPFEFKNVEMQYDSCKGLHVRCRWVAPAINTTAHKFSMSPFSMSPVCCMLQHLVHLITWQALLAGWLAGCIRCHRAAMPPLRRYLLRVTVSGKGMTADSKRDLPFWVRNYDLPPEAVPPIKVGGYWWWCRGARAQLAVHVYTCLAGTAPAGELS